MGYSPWGQKESDTTERLGMHTHTPLPSIVISPLPFLTHLTFTTNSEL